MTFWYGMSFEEVGEMPMASIEAYLERLPARFAEMKLVFADVVSLPHMKDHQRSERLREWMREVEMFNPTMTKPASPARLRMMGVGVRYVQ